MSTSTHLDSMTNVPDKVINYFIRKTAFSFEQSKEIFSELVLYLGSKKLPSRVPSAMVDEAWHAFLLHTIEYERFCNSNYGRFIHHVPREFLDEESCSNCSISCDRISIEVKYADR